MSSPAAEAGRSPARKVLVRGAAAALLIPALAWATACAARKPANLGRPAAAPAPAVAPTPGAEGATVPAPGPRRRPPGPPPLVGRVSRADLEGYVTWTELRAQDYVPDPPALETIAARASGVTVLAIVGTWCADSKREVPRFFKIADLAGLSVDRVTLVAVDRTKRDAGGLTEEHQITRVPTFVFFRGGREIGRVVEKPATTLEGEIAAILGR